MKVHVLPCGYIRIAKTADDPDCIKVLCSHDPAVEHGAIYEGFGKE